MAGNALLAGHHEVNGLQPQVQWKVAFLKNRALADCELLAALAALPQAVAFFALRVLLARLCADALKFVGAVNTAAMGANRTILPKHRLDMSEGGGFVVHVRSGQNRH